MGSVFSHSRVIAALFAACLASAGSAACGSGLTNVCERTSDGVRLVRGGRVVWAFSALGDKPGVHPLTLPDGTTATDSLAADHPWHRGLWFCWKYLNGVNYWETDECGRSEGEQRVSSLDVSCDGGAATVRMGLLWGRRAEPFCAVLDERRTIEFSAPAEDGSYDITWRASFTARERTEIGRTPPSRNQAGEWRGGYAGFSLRLSPAFAAAAVTRSSSGGQTQAEVVARERRWLDYSAPGRGGVRVEVLAAPAKTVFYHWSDRRFTNFSPVFDEPIVLERGEKLDLAYRVTVHADGK